MHKEGTNNAHKNNLKNSTYLIFSKLVIINPPLYRTAPLPVRLLWRPDPILYLFIKDGDPLTETHLRSANGPD